MAKIINDPLCHSDEKALLEKSDIDDEMFIVIYKYIHFILWETTKHHIMIFLGMYWWSNSKNI